MPEADSTRQAEVQNSGSGEKETGTGASDKDNVKYVLSGQPTGWAAMDEVVQKYDEEKIEETKVDIDTLLVIVCVLHPFESARADSSPLFSPSRRAWSLQRSLRSWS